MSIHIETTFDYAGGVIEIELTDNFSMVQFKKNNQIVLIENSSGGIADWSRLYSREWAGLSGAALRGKEQAFAKDYAIEAIGNYILFAADELSNL